MYIGTLVAGRYRLDGPIATGGMGEVWRGFDMLLERRVAVKVLHRGLDDSPRAQDRFAREAKILAALRGPGLVEVYDCGEDASGRRKLRYIVMELVEGVPLSALLAERGPLPAEETLRYVAAAAEALAVAHGGGVVHRDVKPGNLLVESDGRLRVVDFGISLTDGEARLTSADGIMGTPSYVSPEQLAGREVGGAADLYSLGAVAYECLTGRPPFDAEDPRGIVHSHLYEEPPPLPESVPPAVAAIVARCLRKDPAERWASAAELAAACRRAKRSEEAPAEARGRRVPRAVYLVAALVLVLAVVAVWQHWPPSGADAESGAPAVAFRSTERPSGPGVRAAESVDEPSQEPSVAAGATALPVETTSDPGGGDESSPAVGGTLPDVVGMDAAEARDHLNELGWTDVRIASTLLFSGPQPQGCEIVSQRPEAGSEADFDEAVDLAYWGLHECP
ncbi:serine/threonine protein kinase [Glycomyces paridis]|uniref:serine/threonine protein kinase n=1 Tax=Glycomyces paridis TaxID=2126555 RepID=UPI0013053741|nr:serine/threonine protein kinase [Glycomyces paridis]